jgi:hypothetical protein
MNDCRYRSYVEVSRLLSSDLFNALEREVLMDAAEGLLLMGTPDEWEMAELESTVGAALAGLIAAERIHVAVAADLRRRIRECGPPGRALIAV